ncbi:hypothetical protein TRIP_B330514 [uncultured Desulfatiglans sp.]|uniref:Uncharacterized protein n=1 Tax=Uncultured Desulfatiglans sp. TaxID=1748965 RepID=A0A653A8Y1_UNCDX|nr:hypothetical protein TRIP_B330514 [uncultured Desulfatiglans sp.]
MNAGYRVSTKQSKHARYTPGPGAHPSIGAKKAGRFFNMFQARREQGGGWALGPLQAQ